MKKQLTERDYAILRARGINKLHTSTDFVLPSDNYSSYKKPVKKVKAKKPVNPNVNHELVGKYLHTSWGYNMTINEFCKIVEVSPTGKTVVCRMVTKEGFNGYQGEVKAGKEMVGPKFRLQIRSKYEMFIGSYPFSIRTNGDVSKRKGYFSIHNIERACYENHMD